MRTSPPRTFHGCGALDRPFLVAHRAGNELGRLRAAEAAGVSLIEADVRLFRGRVEVRHLKSVGPLPLFWDRWQLAPPWRARLSLADLLAQGAPTTELMLDLKGPRRRLSELVIETVEPYLGQRPLTVCARSWRLLEPFRELPVRRIYSVGSERQLRDLRSHLRARLDGVSVHERLLDAAIVAELRRMATVVMTWPVNDTLRATELIRIGVDGLITDHPEALAGLHAEAAG